MERQRVTLGAVAVSVMILLTSAPGHADPSSPGRSHGAQAFVGMTAYQSSRYGFGFEYRMPFRKSGASWEARSGNSVKSVFVFNERGPRVGGQYREAFGVNVYRLNTTITPGLLPAVRQELKGVLRDLEGQDPSMNIGNLRRVRISGLHGFAATGNFYVRGVRMKTRMTFLFNGKVEYQLLEQTTGSRWYQSLGQLSAIRQSFYAF